MRLLQILLTQSEGGAETFFEKISIALEKNPDIEQSLIIEAHAKRESRLKKAGCKVTTLSINWLYKKLFYNPKLQICSRRFKPDITLAWMNRGARKAPRVPGSIKVARIGGYYPIKNFISCDYLIANTPELVPYMVDQGWDPKRIAMISNYGEIPLDTEHGPDPRAMVPAGTRILLTLGRLHKNKAQDILIRALTHIPDTHLMIAGIGGLKESLEKLAETEGVADRVHFIGWRRDTKYLFDRSDLCVFPSREEALGNVVLEAWATRTPIVAADSSGPAWLIDHGKNGLLCPKDDAQSLAAEVNRLLADQSLCDSLVENGYHKFETQFSKKVILDQYNTFFSEILAAKKEQRDADLSRWA
jgi:glycosyltransferase involved in cell wall biosynthesis